MQLRGEKQLVAYVVPASLGGFSADELKRHLAERLPHYMVPAHIVRMDRLPLNPNGKVDRSALPAPDRRRPVEVTAGSPVSELEEKIAALRGRILSCGVGLDESFFDLGGTSLQLIEVHAELTRMLGRRLSVTDMFEHATVRSLAGRLAGDGTVDPALARRRTVRNDRRKPSRDRNGQRRPDHERNPYERHWRRGGRHRHGRPLACARNVAEFWRNVRDGVECISRFSTEELEVPDAAALASKPDYVMARSVVEGVDQFDAAFFGILPKEAELMDPQHRVFLECCWEALEDAGHDPQTYTGAIGVFAGCSTNTYFLRNLCVDRDFIEGYVGAYPLGGYPTMLGAIADSLATRVSYKLNLRGPSLTIQTACSTSLVAVCQACQGLLNYQCDMALAGGVSITFPQKRGYLYQEGGIGSADGRCRPFDADARGAVFGSGAGVVLLKRLEDALADGDHVYAVVKGFAVNNDGAGKAGYTAPSVDGQANVVATAQALADVDPESITYLEAHGTATPLGDPIEFAALTRAFRHEPRPRISSP